MEYLILNEESTPYPTREEADDKFPEFIKMLDDALRTQLKVILVSDRIEDPNWYNNQIGPKYFCRDWVHNIDKDLERKFKSTLGKTEFLRTSFKKLELWERYELSKFSLLSDSDVRVPSLGAAYLSKQLAVSFASHENWEQTEIELQHIELTVSGDQDNQVIANNFFDNESWETYKNKLLEERKQNLKNIRELWDQREKLFPNLVFANPKDFKKFPYNNTIFGQLYDALRLLNEYCEKEEINFSVLDVVEKTDLKISDESDSVKQNPKLRRHREFIIESEKKFFGLHVKNFSGALRLHFFTDPDSKIIYIGYFGKHLPT